MTLSIAATVVATLIAALIVLNMSLGNKQVDAELKHSYAVADPQFPRTMGGVLSPALDATHVSAVDHRGRRVDSSIGVLLHS